MKITTLCITHRHGTNIYSCVNEEVANTCLYDFVSKYWHEQFQKEPLPQNHEKAIHYYFFNGNNDECYEISTTELIES